MAFELYVVATRFPETLKSDWEHRYREHGFDVEICPDFTPSTWGGGFLPFRVVAAPASLIGLTLPAVAVSGFEVWFKPDRASFRSATGRPTTEFALICLGAALLCELTDGEYVDPQSGMTYRGTSAIDAAKNEIAQFLHVASAEELFSHDFPGWQELGVSI